MYADHASPRRERLLPLLLRVRLTWRERCLLLALAELTDARGWVTLGDVRLSEEAARLGTRAAEEGRHGRGAYRGWTRPFGPRYFRRVLTRLVRLGLVRRWWPPLGPSRRWVRVLAVWEPALADCADVFPTWDGRRWDSRRDTIPASAWPDPSRAWVVGPFMRRILSLGRTHARTADNWRQAYGRDAIGHIV